MDLAKKKTCKASVERVPSTAVSAEEMDVDDSFKESSNLSLPLETVSAASVKASPSFTVDQDHAVKKAIVLKHGLYENREDSFVRSSNV